MCSEMYCLCTFPLLVDNIRMDFAEVSSSDEDDPFDMIGMGGRRGNNDRDGDPLGEVYPYAWALDGRRIGENTPVIRPSSPTSSFVSVYICAVHTCIEWGKASFL